MMTIEELSARIVSLEERVSLLEQQAATSGEGVVAENNAAVPIPSIPGGEHRIATNVPSGGHSEAKVLENILLEPMTDGDDVADTNIRFDITDDDEDTTHIKIGVYYV